MYVAPIECTCRCSPRLVAVYRAYWATKNKQIDLNASIAIEYEPRTGRRTDKSCVPAFFFLNENKFYFAYESKCVSKCLLLPFHFFSYFGSRCYLFVSEMEKINQTHASMDFYVRTLANIYRDIAKQLNQHKRYTDTSIAWKSKIAGLRQERISFRDQVLHSLY